MLFKNKVPMWRELHASDLQQYLASSNSDDSSDNEQHNKKSNRFAICRCFLYYILHNNNIMYNLYHRSLYM